MKWICFFLVAGTVACKSGNKEAEIKAPEHVQFRLLPELNKKYSYSLVNESEMKQEVNDRKFENITKLEIDADYTFSKDTAAGMRLTMSYQKFKLYIKAMDEEKKLDASTAAESFAPSDKMFAAFNNAAVTATVDSVGNASGFSGLDVIKTKMTAYAGTDEEALQMLNGSIRQYVSDQFFKQSIENSLKAFTTRKLKIGDTVMVSTPVGEGLNISASVVYKLVSIKNDIATVTVNADVSLKDQILNIENTPVNANIDGSQKGEIKINFQSGLLENSETILSLHGTMQMIGADVPFKMKTRNVIKRTS